MAKKKRRDRARPSTSGEVPRTLEDFLTFCLTAANQAEPTFDVAFVMVDDAPHGGILCLQLTEKNEGDIATLFRRRPRRFAGWASLTGWAPDEISPVKESWVVLAVQEGLPAAGAVRNVEEQRWTRLEPDDLPWMYLSTAGSLRKWLQGDFEHALKRGHDPRLFRRIGEDEPPPADEHGRI